MTLRHFRIFLAACDAESMTLAAERLGIAQPSVSQCVAELERHYGIALFDRIGRSIRITEAGKTLRIHASQILRSVDEAERGLFELQDGGSLRVGASMTIGTALLPSILGRLLQIRPRLRLKTRVENTAAIIDRLQSGELDLGLVEGSSEWMGIVTQAFYEDELRLICPPDHEWAGLSGMLPAGLSGKSFIVREEGSGTREVFAAAMAAADLDWEASAVVNSAETTLAMVEKGLGVSFISPLLAEAALSSGRVAEVDLRGLSMRRRFRIARHKNRLVTDAMRDFIESCVSFGRSAGFAAESPSPPRD